MADVIKRDDLDGQLKARELEGKRLSRFLPSRGVVPREVVSAAEQAAAIIEEAREGAQEILNQAKAMKQGMTEQVEAERTRGYEEGQQAGFAEATELIAAATAEREQLLHDAEPEVVSMVFQIAEKILGDAIAEGGVTDVVRRAISEAIGERVTVRVHPEDLERIREIESELNDKLQNIKSLNIVADEAIEKGGCAVDTEVGTIDAQLSTQLAAIKKSLGLSE